MWFFLDGGGGILTQLPDNGHVLSLSETKLQPFSVHLSIFFNFSCLVRDNGHLESFTNSGILALRVAYHWGGVKADLFFSVCVQFFKTKFYHSIQLFSPDLKSLFLHLPKLLDFKWRKQEIHEEKIFEYRIQVNSYLYLCKCISPYNTFMWC